MFEIISVLSSIHLIPPMPILRTMIQLIQLFPLSNTTEAFPTEPDRLVNYMSIKCSMIIQDHSTQRAFPEVPSRIKALVRVKVSQLIKTQLVDPGLKPGFTDNPIPMHNNPIKEVTFDSRAS